MNTERPGRKAREAGADLTGRSDELDLITAVIDDTARLNGSLTLFGDPGVGKSALLDAAADLARARGMRTLRAAGAQFEARMAFAGLNQLLLPLAPLFAELDPGQASALRVALGFGDGATPSRILVSTATLSLLLLAAQEQPLVAIVDDAQWLDDASADVLSFVARRVAGTRVRVLTTVRTTGEPLRNRGDINSLTIHALDPAQSEALLLANYPDLAEHVRRRIVSEAQGNPLALVELPATLTSARYPTADALPTVLPLTERLTRMFTARITALAQETRDLLLLLALDGSGQALSEESVVGPDAAAHLDIAERERIVVVDNRHTVVFRHPLVRSAVVELARPEQQRRAHQALAGCHRSDPGRRTWHLADASLGPDEEVATLLQHESIRALNRGDPSAAVAAMTRSAHLSPDPDHRSQRLAGAAYFAAEVMGDLHTASQLLNDARRLDTDLGSLATASAAASLMLYSDADVVSAFRVLTTALRAPEADPTAEEINAAIWVLSVIASLNGRKEMWDPYLELVDRYRDLLPEGLLVRSEVVSNPALVSPEALNALDQEIATLATELDPGQIIRVGYVANDVDRLSDLREPLLRVWQDAARTGAVASVTNALMLLCAESYLAGRWDDTQRFAEEGLERAQSYGYVNFVWFLHYSKALAAAALGQQDEAEEPLEAMLAWAIPRQAFIVPQHVYRVRTLAAIGRGDFETAYTEATRISPHGLEPGTARQLQLFVAYDLVEAAVRTGRTDQAQGFVEAMLRMGITRISSRWTMLVAAAQGLVSEGDVASAHFERALAAAPEHLWPFERGRVLLAFGELLRRERATVESRVRINAALTVFDRLRAAPWAERARSELAATGVSRRQADSADVQLTPQELQIATLAASGLTNKAIGERLHLSARTVSGHLYNVFPKLGVTARAGLRDALTARTEDRPPPQP
ncbi:MULTISPECIES: AAA family ATPase [Streptacidiphilus]|uniref:AAA family ATPase n=1 Tax=Streptacidiphilus cavernicola TaxID=3342716 RepID=A0ABV6UL24_9ACTN|nr:LuxR family transcriptional regulator [Streptacidiphilus jeojiense]